MAPSFLALGTAALALAGDVAAKQFVLDDTYDSTNFFDKFDFFESRYGTGDYNDVDLTSGYINYRTRVDAQKLGLISNAGGEVYLGPDAHNVTEFPGVGRSSVRLESKAIYNKSLMVARFSHLPKPVCGAWPAFWSYGAPWPKKGELDWFEGWNNAAANKPAAHTYHSSEQGQCIISEAGQTSKVNTANCDQWAPGQYQNEGCTATATSADPWGSADGGIYAVEWTDDYIKFFAWTHGAAPKDIGSDSPDTSSWGTPSMLISNDKCNINSHFSDQKLVINIDFCGVLAGNEYIWKDQCAASTGHAVCSSYVAQNPSAYKDTYFKIKDIRVFKEGSKPVISTSASVSTTSVSASASISHSASASDSASAFVSASASASASASHSVSASDSHLQTGTAKVTDKSVSVSNSQNATGTASTSKSASATATGTATGTITASASVTKSASASGSGSISVKSNSVTDEDVCTEDDDGVTTKTAVTSKDAVTTKDALTNKEVTTTKSAIVTENGITNKQTPAVSTTAAQLTTSTVYTTKVSTITACPPAVTDCPDRIGKVITQTIALYTTVCPVSSVPAPKPTEPVKGKDSDNKPNPGPGVSTTTFTTVYTITKCPSSVPSCPIGSVTTKVVTTSVPAAGPSVPIVTKVVVPSGPHSGPGVTKTLSLVSSSGLPPKPSAPNGKPPGYNATTPVIKASTLTASKPSGTVPGASTTGCSGPSCPTKPIVVVNAAVQAGASFALMALGALAVFAL
ncbi:beta- -endoglucanase [Colletotrichum incanum]|uniref:Beta--endoglucanase n=1 Tax=Colletotrichum incanum TaxID=1573173 RepID=A0A167CAS3_COLIC|nr:beta- -endoglucanase [Colletotrichum incanum]OHW94561.1 beta-endoglucanase [Colletotrichum incanum]